MIKKSNFKITFSKTVPSPLQIPELSGHCLKGFPKLRGKGLLSLLTLLATPIALRVLFMTPIVLLFTLSRLHHFHQFQGRQDLSQEAGRRGRAAVGNCRHIYLLLTGTTTLTHPLSWLTQQPQHTR